ncbi:alpha/beta fold hydrolase [Streptomyces sp. NPDC002018]|uniref:alpha/beta fold hydrolase n=1 Tax=Streptomyces sp. NPDC002018 TaxID=3364629 RepID=UPI003694C435
MSRRSSGRITTNDGVGIRYLDAGEGEPVVLVPGFSQSAAEFGKQIDDLSRDYRVVAVDLRGHGLSEKPDHGYRVSRLAADLRDLVVTLDLRDATLLGHSLGCAVIWCYWDLFGDDRVRRLILVDQGAVTAVDLVAGERAADLGAVFTADTAFGIAAALRGPEAVAMADAILESMHTPSLSAEDLAWLTEQNLLLPREHAASLHLDHYGNDWRDVLPRITVPTLVIGGEVSIFPPETARWTAARIPRGQVRVFSAEESGSHLLFWENPRLFNSVVRDFIESDTVSGSRT